MRLVGHWLKLAFFGATAADAAAKYLALAVGAGVAYLVAKGASLHLFIGATIAGEPKELLNATGDLANAGIALAVVYGFWLPFTFGLAWAGSPSLRIVGVSPLRPDVDRQRITVRNRSSETITFSANLADTNPGINHHLPAPLQLTGSDQPFREMHIAGRGTAQVEVFLFSPEGPQLLIAGVVTQFRGAPLTSRVPISKESRVIQIEVFPVPPSRGSRDSRHFRIIPRADGRDELEMLPRGRALKATAVALGWFFGGLIPFFIGGAVAGVPGLFFGAFAGVYLVWYFLRDPN